MPRDDATSRPRRASLRLADHARGADFYVDGLTGLRGIAAFWVFLVHAWAAAGDPAAGAGAGGAGVPAVHLRLHFHPQGGDDLPRQHPPSAEDQRS